MRETDFQSALRRRIENEIPGSVVQKGNPNWIQGFPDLIVLYKNTYACLECKKSADEPYRPNQEYYIEQINSVAFCATVYPENEEEILDELKRYFDQLG